MVESNREISKRAAPMQAAPKREGLNSGGSSIPFFTQSSTFEELRPLIAQHVGDVAPPAGDRVLQSVRIIIPERAKYTRADSCGMPVGHTLHIP